MRLGLKKTLVFSLACVAVLGLAACGNKKESDKASGGKVSWFSDVAGYGTTANWKVDKNPLMEYAEKEFGLELEMEAPPSDATTKLGLMIASGDIPDLITVSSAESIKQLTDSDAVWRMEDFLKKYDPDSHLLKDFPEDVKQVVTDKYGDWYSIPSHLNSEDNRKMYPPTGELNQAAVERGSNSAILVNTDILKEAGLTLDDLKTESGLLAAIEKVKNANLKVDGKEVVPFMLHGNRWLEFSLDNIIAWNFGALPVDADGNYQHRELSPGYKNALKFINTTVRNGTLDLNSMTIDETALKTYVSDKRVFMIVGNSANFTAEDNMNYVAVEGFKADNGAKPVFPKGKQATGGWLQTMVSKNAKNPEALAKFISYATSEEGLILGFFGTEDMYKVNDDGTITATEEGAKKIKDDFGDNMGLWNFANTSFDQNKIPAPAEGTANYIAQSWKIVYGATPDVYQYEDGLTATVTDNLIEPSSDLGIKLGQLNSYLTSQKGKIVNASDDATFEAEYNNMIETMKDKYSVEEIDKVFNDEYQKNVKNIGQSIEDVNASLYK